MTKRVSYSKESGSASLTAYLATDQFYKAEKVTAYIGSLYSWV